MIFINNKYTVWYFNIIKQALLRSLPKDHYIERHHIIPKSAGGSNKKDNLARLTAKEHFVCHRLLPKMVNDSTIKSKLLFASWAMATMNPQSHRYGDRRRCTSSYYVALREHVASENRKRQTGVSPGNKGSKHSEDRKQKNRDVPFIQCPHCGKSFKPWTYARFHGNKCSILTKFCGPMPQRPKTANNVRSFKAISPDGNITISSNLKQFCQKSGLSFAQCRRTAVGLYPEYKGWQFSYLH